MRWWWSVYKKKNRVTAAQFASIEAIANTPRSPRFFFIIAYASRLCTSSLLLRIGRKKTQRANGQNTKWAARNAFPCRPLTSFGKGNDHRGRRILWRSPRAIIVEPCYAKLTPLALYGVNFQKMQRRMPPKRRP